MSAPTPPDRVALVTGGSGSIGAATALALAADGRAVAVAHRSGADAAEATAARIRDQGGRAIAVPLDVTDPASVGAAVDTVVAELGPIGILVNNAGTTADGLFLRMSAERFHEPFATSVHGAFHLTSRVAPAMVRARWGRIVNISSVVALSGSAGQVNYGAAKAAVVGFSRSLARELAGRSVTVNVVAPGPVASPMLDEVGPERVAALAASVPLGRIGEPDEVAATIAFLCSEPAAYITGAVVPVDGGLGLGH
jgi:3-oxoacyl-[acyl-carrier protein] reductase